MKKILVFLLSLLIVVFSVVPVFAVDDIESLSNVKYMNTSILNKYLGNYGFSLYDYSAFQDFTNYSLMSISYYNPDGNTIGNPNEFFSVDCFSFDATDFKPVFDRGSVAVSANCTGKYSFYPDASIVTPNGTTENLTEKSIYVWNNNDDFVIVNDLDIYNSIHSLVAEARLNGYDVSADNLYYCDDPRTLFLKYINNLIYADYNVLSAPDEYSASGIVYSNGVECPYAEVGSWYENEMHDYETAGLYSKIPSYFHNEFNLGSSYDHDETIDFFYTLDVTDYDFDKYMDLQIGWIKDYSLFGKFSIYELFDFDTFFNDNFCAIHYKKDDYTVIDYFNNIFHTEYTNYTDFIKNEYISLYAFKQEKNITIFIHFRVNSRYTLDYVDVPTTGGLGNVLFIGDRFTHNSIYLDDNGVNTNDNGLGSDISQADPDRSRPYTQSELKEMGFEFGFPNTDGNFPFYATIYRNGLEYFRLYFSKQPFVSSTYFSDKCIDYCINVDNMKIYMYFKEQNMSKVFDFTKLVNDDNWFYNQDIYNNSVPISDLALTLLKDILFVDTETFKDTYNLHIWTNYTGDYPENFNGFYCKFNWSLDGSDLFEKNNSDDNYDYSQDYVPEDSITDNNGNIHGGAVETPTEGNISTGPLDVPFEFSVSALYEYCSLMFNFLSRTFSLLPDFFWYILLVSLVIVVVLRIAGR